MHPKNHPPIFVPPAFVPELEHMTKAALMDLVWDLATATLDGGTPDEIMSEVRKCAAFVVVYREQQL